MHKIWESHVLPVVLFTVIAGIIGVIAPDIEGTLGRGNFLVLFILVLFGATHGYVAAKEGTGTHALPKALLGAFCMSIGFGLGYDYSITGPYLAYVAWAVSAVVFIVASVGTAYWLQPPEEDRSDSS